jgi:hypothetical protein
MPADDCQVIAWHYTNGLKLPLIRESGCLRPTDVGIGPAERPVLWFSTAPYWEPTSAKGWSQPFQDGPPRTLSMQENAERGEGLYRFGLPASALIRWPEIGKRAGIKAALRNSLMRVGRKQGANPAQWYGTFQEISIAGLALQQLVDFRYWATKDRITHRDNQLKEIAGLEIRLRALPLSDFRETAEDDRSLVNHIRHRLTNYHRLLERFDAGDSSVLNMIRTKVYNAISAAYPELASECARQLTERR